MSGSATDWYCVFDKPMSLATIEFKSGLKPKATPIFGSAPLFKG